MISDRHLFLNILGQTSGIPPMLEVEKAEGSFIVDKVGNKHLDLISGISVSCIGHKNPVVINAIKDQLDRHLHVMVFGEFVQSPQTRYAKLLIDNLPENLNNVFFVNSGSEAAEGALKLAKRYTGRKKIISFINGYHGSTQGALSLAGGEFLKNAFRPLLPGIFQLNFNNIDDLQEIDEETACVFIEPVQGEAGAIPAEPSYIQQLQQKCKENGVLLVVDEIQSGFGRTGKLWAFQHYNMKPDILLLGKALGGGLPLGAFITNQHIMNLLSHDPVLGHITTFGGNPLSCAAGKAVLEYILEKDLLAQSEKKGQFFRDKINDQIVNGKGLMLSIEVGDFERVQKLVKACYKNFLITDWFVFNDKCIRVAPPLTISYDELEMAANIINNCLKDL